MSSRRSTIITASTQHRAPTPPLHFQRYLRLPTRSGPMNRSPKEEFYTRSGETSTVQAKTSSRATAMEYGKSSLARSSPTTVEFSSFSPRHFRSSYRSRISTMKKNKEGNDTHLLSLPLVHIPPSVSSLHFPSIIVIIIDHTIIVQYSTPPSPRPAKASRVQTSPALTTKP